MDDFTAYFFSWVCVSCSVSPLRVRVGVSSKGELLAQWVCNRCKRRIMASIPLEEVICQVPPAPQQKLIETKKEELTEADQNLLKKAHILWLEDRKEE